MCAQACLYRHVHSQTHTWTHHTCTHSNTHMQTHTCMYKPKWTRKAFPQVSPCVTSTRTPWGHGPTKQTKAISSSKADSAHGWRSPWGHTGVRSLHGQTRLPLLCLLWNTCTERRLWQCYAFSFQKMPPNIAVRCSLHTGRSTCSSMQCLHLHNHPSK